MYQLVLCQEQVSQPGNFSEYLSVSVTFLAGFSPAAAMSVSGSEHGCQAVFAGAVVLDETCGAPAAGELDDVDELAVDDDPLLQPAAPTTAPTARTSPAARTDVRPMVLRVNPIRIELPISIAEAPVAPPDNPQAYRDGLTVVHLQSQPHTLFRKPT